MTFEDYIAAKSIIGIIGIVAAIIYYWLKFRQTNDSHRKENTKK